MKSSPLFSAPALLLLVSAAAANTLKERDIDRRFPSEWCPVENRTIGGVENLVNFIAPANGTVEITFMSEYLHGVAYNGSRIDNVIVLQKSAFDRLKRVECQRCFTLNPGVPSVPLRSILGRRFVKFIELFDTDPNRRTPSLTTVWHGGSWYPPGSEGSSAPHVSTDAREPDDCSSGASGSWTLGKTAEGDSVSTTIVVGELDAGIEYVVLAWFHILSTCQDSGPPGFGSDCATLKVRVDEALPLPPEPYAPTGVDESGLAGSSASLRLDALPNPAFASVSVAFELPVEGDATLRIYDGAGRLVRTLVDGHSPSGPQSVVWDLRNDDRRSVVAGVYFYRLDAGEEAITRKLTVAR